MTSRIAESVLEKGPVCVGLDPRRALLPPELLDRGVAARGPGASGIAEAYRLFGREVIDLVAPYAAAIKPQVAFFETLLAPGMDAFVDVCRHARTRGLISIADVKRGDIGSTAEAYARSIFAPEDGGGSVADLCTVNPLFGSDGVAPFVTAAVAQGGGVFALVRTSNPSASELQDLLVDGVAVHRHVASLVRRWNEPHLDADGYGPVGAVVGATRPDLLAELRRELPSSVLLVPGYGAQGAGPADVAAAFDRRGGGALVSASRSITYPWGATACPENWREAIVQAVLTMRDALTGVRGGG